MVPQLQQVVVTEIVDCEKLKAQNEVMRKALIQLEERFTSPHHSDSTALMLVARALMGIDRLAKTK